MRAARVHHAARRRGGGMADRGAGAAAERVRANRSIYGPRRARRGMTDSCRGVPQRAARPRLDRGPQRQFDTRWTGGDPARMRRTCGRIGQASTRVIMNGGLHHGGLATGDRTMPIVFAQVLDPVGAGFVESLARPGGNVTGFVGFEYTMAGKWLETLKLHRAAHDAGSRHSRSRDHIRDGHVGVPSKPS